MPLGPPRPVVVEQEQEGGQEALAAAPAQEGPQVPPPQPVPRTTAQRLERIEDEIRLVCGSIEDQREAIQGIRDKQRWLGSWLVERMTEVMEERGMRYQRYDGPIITNTHIHFER